jgi:Ca2+-binding RTX toxin-like protein
MEDRNLSTPAWWEDRGGAHFQNGLLPDFDAPDGQVYTTGLTLSDLAGANVINGTIAEDLIMGGAGNDSLSGFADDDFIIGGAGNDTLSDGFGNDVMSGGSGADVFVLSLDGASDRISDFETGIDRIDVSSWGISGFGDLAISSGSRDSTITYAGETLVVAFVGGSDSLGSSDFVI